MNKTWTLLKMQARSLLGRRNRKKSSVGIAIAIGLGVITALVSLVIMTVASFSAMVVLCDYGYTWLYFSMVGIICICLCVFGSIMMAENVLYSARDNDLMLSMPIKPGQILMSRMGILFAFNFIISTVIMVIAAIVYKTHVDMLSIQGVIGFVVSLVCIPVIAQMLVCLLGWLLHILLSKVNSAVASLTFIIVFLFIYFAAVNKSNDFLMNIAANGDAIANKIQSFGWLMYVMGMACQGEVKYALIFIGISAVIAFLTWIVLSATFLKVITMTKHERRKSFKQEDIKVRSVSNAIALKEFRHFISSSVYLSNMGIGLVLMVIATVFGIAAKEKVASYISMMGLDITVAPMAIFLVIGFLISMTVVTSPTISLEGKNLWIMKSMPINARTILKGKIKFGIIVTLPLAFMCTLVLVVGYGCGMLNSIILLASVTLLTLICQIFGVIFNLRFYNFDWLNETVPCKQGISVILTILLMWLLTIIPAGIFIVADFSYFTIIAALYLLPLAAVAGGSYLLIRKWGVRTWENL